MSVKLDSTNLTEEQMVAIPKSLERMRSFIEEYSVIEPLYDLYDGEDIESLEVYSGMTFEQLESVTIADAYYAILKNVQAISENEGMTDKQVVEKGLEDVDWYKKALKNALNIQLSPFQYPTNVVYPKDVLSKDVFNWREHEFEKALETARNTFIYYGLTFGSEYLDEILTPIHRIIIGAASNLYNNGIEAFTLNEVYRTMVCNKNAKLTEKKAQELLREINFLSTTRLTVILDQESKIEKWGIELENDTRNLLETRIIGAVRNGVYDDYIFLREEPFLSELSKRNRQAIEVDPFLLDVPKLHKTDKHLVLTYYLYEQIERMKSMNVSEDKQTIVYETLYKHLRMTDATPKELTRLRKAIKEKILPYWKATKVISDFTEIKKGKSPEKIKLILPKN